MNTTSRLVAASGVLAVLVLGGCETMNSPFNTGGASQGTPQAQTAYSGYGVVQAIEVVQQAASSGIGGSGIGVGTIAGAVVGGVLGNQVGGGSGQTAATVAGAAGGAYVGNQIDKGQQRQTATAYRFNIRMDNGAYQTLTQASDGGLRVGDRVRIQNGAISRY